MQATYTFSIPYVYTVQTQGLSFPVHMWYDGKSQRLRMDVFDGLDSTTTEKVLLRSGEAFRHGTQQCGQYAISQLLTETDATLG